MTKRVLGGLAAVAMMMGAIGCGSSSDSAPTNGPAKDTGTGGDAGGETSTGPTGETGPSATADKTTGLECKSDDDCDKTAGGVAHCSNAVYAVGPLNPTPVCIQVSSSDVCTPTDATTIRFCDGDMGICTKSASNPATCDAMCIMNADGSWKQKCAGKNGCYSEAIGNDPTSMKATMVGSCHGGCSVDADCPTGSKCDPVEKFCTKTCAADADCTKDWTSPPSNWGCDTARGACTFKFPKKLGDECTSAADCPCLKSSSAPKGYCIHLCKANEDCGTGFTCDGMLPKKDDKGADLFTLTAQPPELVGYCLKNCSADTDCPASQICDNSAGVTQKTCRPKPGA